MKIIAPTKLVVLLYVVVGTGIGTLSWIPLLFFTSMGDSWPDWMKLGMPLALWGVAVIFFVLHRTPDKKSIEFRIL